MLAIDHLVIVSDDPKRDATKFAQEHQVNVMKGGTHELWGTFNYLAFFDNDCYIEWLGIFDESSARQSDNPLIKQTVSFLDDGRTGLMTYALRTDKLDEYLEHFQKNNIGYKGPFPGSRTKTDGSLLSWRMLFSSDSILPFLIEWKDGINLPDDKSIINPIKIDTVKVPRNPNYEKVFRLQEKNDSIQLANGLLQFTDEQPTFSLKSFT